ncbi:hypothetical protein WT83_27530 [Burkholderia territorii]|uniref:DUF262 domain-containing protein n=1 Tax=Burkholderia territorii TaxID=1503055 RepID=A0A119VEA6_9BURK|nr:DUF262 domain-containing protein [Burkholderia territorii]KWN06436.1 hypothetical protein WT83_27530 [Burkholderia territorii]
MQPNKVSPLSLFSQPLQYLVPIFQRGYVWTIERQIHALWTDIAERATELAGYQQLAHQATQSNSMHMVKQPRKHFLGTVIITDHRSGQPGEPVTAEVIDGQQRMTTTQLLALAFRDAVSNVEDVYLRQAIDMYTHNAATYREPHYHYKVWPTNAGRAEISALVSARSFAGVCQQYPITTVGTGRSKKHNPRPLLVEAYLYFYGVISMFIRGKEFDEPVLDKAGSTEEVLNELLREVGVDMDATWATQWTHAIRHDTHPALPFENLPIIPQRVNLLLSTLTDYLQLIELRLGPDDDAQVIFESLNDRGERLTAADLVRNFVFLEATRSNTPVDKLYTAHWQDFDEAPAEKGAIGKTKLFWKIAERQGRLTNTRLDTFLYHYVSMRTMEDVKLDHVFESFKQWWNREKRDVNAELARLKAAASLFRALVLPDRTTRLGRFAHNMRVLDSSTMIPVVLLLGERLGVDSPEFFAGLRILESYVMRRAICGLTSKAYNRVFPGIVRVLSPMDKPSAAAIAQHLDTLGGGVSQHWPDNSEFGAAWLSGPTYRVLRSAKTRMLLEALELGMRGAVHHESATLPDVPLHVEHVLPIAWRNHWTSPGDENAELVRDQILHNVGNLTLLTAKLNPKLSDSDFDTKRPEITLSLLALNAHFQDARWLAPGAAWNEAEIRARAGALLNIALQIWPREGV